MLVLYVKNQTKQSISLTPGNSGLVARYSFELGKVIAVKLNLNLLIIMLKVDNPDS